MPIIRASALTSGELKGGEHGATLSLIFDHSQPGERPRPHRHPYDGTWVVHEGNLTFQLGAERHPGGPGEIVIAPPGVSHKFTNDGPGTSALVCIHATPTMSPSGSSEIAHRADRPLVEHGGRGRLLPSPPG